MNKEIQYSLKLSEAIAGLFREDSDNYIDPTELEDDDNLRAFIHALLNMTPTSIFNTLTGHKKNCLEVNHVANHLIIEYTLKNQEGGSDVA